MVKVRLHYLSMMEHGNNWLLMVELLVTLYRHEESETRRKFLTLSWCWSAASAISGSPEGINLCNYPLPLRVVAIDTVISAVEGENYLEIKLLLLLSFLSLNGIVVKHRETGRGEMMMEWRPVDWRVHRVSELEKITWFHTEIGIENEKDAETRVEKYLSSRNLY